MEDNRDFKRDEYIDRISEDLYTILRISVGSPHVKTDLMEAIGIAENGDTADISLPKSWVDEMKNNDGFFHTGYWVWYYHKTIDNGFGGGRPKNLIELLVTKHQQLPIQDRKDVIRSLIFKLTERLNLNT